MLQLALTSREHAKDGEGHVQQNPAGAGRQASLGSRRRFSFQSFPAIPPTFSIFFLVLLVT